MSAPAPRSMLPPPEERLYASFQDLHEDLKKWTLSQGYALSIDASSNRDASGVYRRYNMSCVKGGKPYKPTAQGKRRSYSKKTGCPMKIKCTKQDGWPWNGRWRVTVLCGDHNHSPFDPDSPDEIPPAFRHVEGEGLRWLLIMHREAQLNLRQLTIGLRATFGDKYKFIKKADVSNMLSKVKREEERELAKRPPGAPPLPPGTMTAFMAALLNPVPDPYANGVRYELISETWPNVPGFEPAPAPQQQRPPQGPPQYTQHQAFQPQHYAHPQQIQGPPSHYGPPQHYVPSQQPPPPNPAYPPPSFTPGQRPLQFKIYGPPPPPPPVQVVGGPQQPRAQEPPQQQHAEQRGQHAPPQLPPQPSQQQQQPAQSQQPSQQQPQQHTQQQPPQKLPPNQQGQAQLGPLPATQGPPSVSSQAPPYMAQQGPPQQPVVGEKSVYRPTTTLQPVPVAGVPGAVVMPRAFSPVSEDESDEAQENEDEDGDENSD